ncbi:hypothetical protein [Jeotgalicoccus sp. S0W5]|uniref:hypothetical protein n=1 Tax=Jeotgalicoccus sp. S0W5 TaxID=2527874 RepID=UPI001415277D|nr:hypothetical protein [Jeotgalicoccus sp. S0W5]
MLKTIKRFVHSFIVWYLFKCGGAFHHGKYDSGEGKYVVIMTEKDYHNYTHRKF